ncbi:MAG TPA: hypothetical protein VNT79_01780 [Phycisphaerae bacterium]|nr:hypothetical protein [Phycisphaerae bacterium]
MTFRLAAIGLSSVVFLSLTGCAKSQLTRQNYDLIRVGSSNKEEVKSALGEQHLVDRGNQWEYDDSKQSVSVWFEFDDNGVVTRKQWYSGEGGLEHDSQGSPDGETVYQGSKRSTTDR